MAPPQSQDPILLFGDLAASSIPEVLTLLNSGRHTGELVLHFDVARKSLFFVDGEVVAVQTNVEDDRLGEVMWRQGLITLDQLMIALEQWQPGQLFGRMLIDNGFTDTRQLYRGLRAQVREVFLSVFHFADGMFCFIGRLPEGLTPFRLEERTESLIMAGIHQLDKIGHMRRDVGGDEAQVVAVSPRPESALEEVEEAVLQLITSAKKPMAVHSIIEKARLGEYQGLKAVASLLKAGFAKQVTVSAEKTAETQSPNKTDVTLLALTKLMQILNQEGFGADEDVRTFLHDVTVQEIAIFQQATPDNAGETGGLIDSAALRVAVQQLNAEGRQQVTQALEEALDFALFQLRETLGTDRAEQVTAEIEVLLSGKP